MGTKGTGQAEGHINITQGRVVPNVFMVVAIDSPQAEMVPPHQADYPHVVDLTAILFTVCVVQGPLSRTSQGLVHTVEIFFQVTWRDHPHETPDPSPRRVPQQPS